MRETKRADLLKFAKMLVTDIKKCDEGKASIEAGTVEFMDELTGLIEHADNGERIYEFSTYTAAKDRRRTHQ